jgi:hypothetical protein
VVDFKKPVKQDNKEESYDESKEYPEVLFTSGVRRLITPEEWNIGGTSHMHLYNYNIYLFGSFLIILIKMHQWRASRRRGECSARWRWRGLSPFTRRKVLTCCARSQAGCGVV